MVVFSKDFSIDLSFSRKRESRKINKKLDSRFRGNDEIRAKNLEAHLFRTRMKKASGIIFLILSCLLLTGCFDIRTNSLGTMLQNLSRSYPAIFQFLAAFSYVSGIWLLFTSLYKFKRYADTRGNMMAYQLHIGQPLIYLLIGLILFYLPTMVSLSIFSFWGTTSIKSYPASSSMW